MARSNGEAIYGTKPWTRSEAKTEDGTEVRFTSQGGEAVCILLRKPGTRTITVPDLAAKAGSRMRMLGITESLKWSAWGKDLQVQLPQTLVGNYAT